MNTYSHALFTWFAARRLRPDRRATAWLAAAGACLPDLPYLARAVSLLASEGRQLTPSQALTELDYLGTPDWKLDLALHSVLPVAPVLGVAGVLPSRDAREGVRAFAAGWAAHNLVDLATHASDARPHLWPLSSRRWHSPVSYWDRRSHAIPVLMIEHAVVLGLALHIGSKRARTSRLPSPVAAGRSQDVTRLLASFVKNPRQVGAVAPTSRSTVRAMLDMTGWERASRVVELGAGTGVYTEELLRRIGPEGRVIAFEIDPGLARRLTDRFDDQRLQVVNDSAELLADYLDGRQADVVVSALPFTTLPVTVREKVFEAIATALAPDGVMLAIQYSTARQRDLERVFGKVRRRRSIRNLPPALLYACQLERPTPTRR